MIKYNHPGSVRVAKNFLCLHCFMVFSTPQGINGHLRKKHHVITSEIEFKKDWHVTGRKACKNVPMPVISR